MSQVYNSSGSLLLSSRSTPHIDVFDNMGAYCYDIPLENHEGIFDVGSAICDIQTVPNHAISSNDKFIEILYVLQYSGIFSAFKIGRLSKYKKMWSVQLDIGQTGSFVVLPQYNLLLVASHYKESSYVNPPAGLCSFRMMDSEPYVEPIRISSPDGGWFSRLPFSTSFMSYLPKMSLSFNSQLLVSVATSGSLYIFEIPSTRVKFSFNYINGPKPIEACFVDATEITIIYDNGLLLRCGLENIEEKMYSMKIRNKKQLEEEVEKKDIYSGHTIMVTPAQREIFLLSAEGDNSVLREAAHKRVQLAGQLWFYTVWNSFKKIVGMAMGESAEPLQMATHFARFDFSLIHSPTRTLQELFNRTLIEHDYSRARELAECYETIDIDVVLKAEWEDKCNKETVKVEDIDSILRDIRDVEWVANQCLNVHVENIEIQKSLINLGLSLSNTSIVSKIHLLHNLRLLEICEINDDIESYLQARNESCLEAILSFASNGDIESVSKMVESNINIMKHYQEDILSAFPSCIYPTKYEYFLPRRLENSEIEQWELEETTGSGAMEKLEQIANENPEARVLVDRINIGSRKPVGSFNFVSWVRQTLKKIDFECGLTGNCVSLLKIAIERGFDELNEDVLKWELYSKFITISSSVSESIISFEDSNVKTIVDKFSKLLESELVEHSASIISIIEWKCNEKEGNVKEALTKLMMMTNERSTKVLVSFRKQREDLIDDNVILDCLLNMTSTGGDLLQSLNSLPVEKYTNVTSSLGSLMSRGVKMTFKSIFESMREPDGARRVLIKLSRSGNCDTIEEWITLRDDVVQMAQGIYSDLITKEEALELIAGEILEDEQIGQHPELMSLVLTLNTKETIKQDDNKLDLEKSAQVLLTKSDELMSEATHKDDPLLGKARFFAVAAKSISAEKAKEKLKWLDAIESAQELGCTMMPIAIKLSDPNSLLNDIVHIGNNYKSGKKIAKLAVQLDIETPVATALSYCALVSLANNDPTYLSRYVGEVISKVKGNEVVHHLCMKIMESNHVPTDMGDIYASAINNCTPEALLSTVDAISQSEKRLEASRKKNININDVPICETIVQDPMYTSLASYNSRLTIDEETKEKTRNMRQFGKDLKKEEMRRLMAYESSTLALRHSLLCKNEEGEEEENISWTNNEKLKRYDASLRLFEKSAPVVVLLNISPNVLIKEANQSNDDVSAAIDRIEDYGCDRNRFLNDGEYREDAIIGLAMTEDDQQFADALELAKIYSVDEWQLHMTSLENALISLSIDEAKRVLKSRGHLSNLRTRIEDFHTSLRCSVFPLLGSNEQFIAYTSIFADSEPEKKVAPAIKKILEKIKRKDVKATKMWTDADYLANILISIPDKGIWSIIETILLIPIGKEACEKAARILLDGTEIRPPAHPFTLFVLIGKDIEEFLELIAIKSREEEIEYLDRASILLEATPNISKQLLDAVRERVETMRRKTVSPVNETSTTYNLFPSFSSDDSGMMKRRKN